MLVRNALTKQQILNRKTLNMNYSMISSFTISFLIADSLPMFEDIDCTDDVKADKCVRVDFSNGMSDILILVQIPQTSIFEGSLKEDKDVAAVMIDTPARHKRVVRVTFL